MMTADRPKSSFATKVASFIPGHLDVRYAFRVLRKNLAFTGVAVITLAIAIGANAAIFGYINTVFFKQLPVNRPENLRIVSWSSTDAPRGYGVTGRLSFPAYQSLQAVPSFSSLACWSGATVNFGAEGRFEGQVVSGTYFPTLGASALIGRTITPEDERDGAAVAVISYALWHRVFGGDTNVLGKTIRVNTLPLNVIGVMPKAFFGLNPSLPSDIYLPTMAYPKTRFEGATARRLEDPQDWSTCEVVARLKDGASSEVAQQQAEAIITQLPELPPVRAGAEPRHVRVENGQYGYNSLRKDTSKSAILLMAVTGFTLLIACSNIAGLLLARAVSRQKEIATRLAIGASRISLVRQLLTESVLLSLVGGIAGLALAYSLNDFLPVLVSSISSARRPTGSGEVSLIPIALDARVFLFSLALCIVTGFVFGLAPALRATRIDLVSAMKQTTASAGRFRFTGGKVLVALQVALSTLLLIGAGLLIRTLVNLNSVPVGFKPEGLLYFSVAPAASGYNATRSRDFFETAVKRLDMTPGVSVAAGAPAAAVLRICNEEGKQQEILNVNTITPRAFEAMQMRVIAGRDITWADRSGQEPVALINEAFARRHFQNRNALGETVDLKFCDRVPLRRIIGIVADATMNPRQNPLPTLYVPFLQPPPQISGNLLTFAVRIPGEPRNSIPAIRGVMAEIDPNLPLFNLETGTGRLDRSTQDERALADLLLLFGGIALFLCCLGIYGMLAYIVNGRRAEIAIRIAIGSGRRSVLLMVVRESLIPVASGLIVGIVAASMLTRWLETNLFGVSRNDPATILAASLAFLVTSAAAAWLPTRRVSRIDVTTSLRQE
jgi:predicted permease